MYLHYCIRSTKSVNCIRFPMKSCINGENCAGITCVYMKLFSFEIQKCGKILCAHKPYFLMLGHIYKHYKSNIDNEPTYTATVAIYVANAIEDFSSYCTLLVGSHGFDSCRPRIASCRIVKCWKTQPINSSRAIFV